MQITMINNGYGAHMFVLALFVIQIPLTFSATAFTNISTDQSALVALKSKLNLNPHHILWNNWSVSTSICSWVGVSCGLRHHRVTALDISSMGLAGNLPPEIGNLSFLESFNLSGNYFRGNLPQDMSRLRRLQVIDFSVNNFTGVLPCFFQFLAQLRYLNLAYNSFVGLLPDSVTNISKLETLDLSFNSLNGEILSQGMGNVYNLRELVLQNNKFSGLLRMEMFNISNLEILSLGGNNFTGGLPADMCNRIPWIQELRLSRNELNGLIPPTISRCSRLHTLSLAFNKFIGHIPTQITNLSGMEKLYLNANNMAGEIPKPIGNLTMLTVFDVSQNNLRGIVHADISHLSRLEILRLSYNYLSGSLLEEIFNISTLQWLSFSINKFSGTLPKFLGYGLPNLQKLYIGGNIVTGRIPESISNASSLISVDISDNFFNGQIPSSLGKLKFLQRLYLDGNRFISESRELSIITSLTNCTNLELLQLGYSPTLNGTLPVTIGNLSSSLLYLNIQRMDLFGSIPNEICNLSNLIELRLSMNQLTGSIPQNLGNMLMLQQLSLSGNKLIGTIPHGICTMGSLDSMYMGENQIEGSIPDCIGALTTLRYLYIPKNNLSFGIPKSLWNLNNLLELNLSFNLLTGSLPPNIGNMDALILLDISMNRFSSNIPDSVGNLQNLKNLSLAYNRFTGSIPESMENMLSLEYMNLSHNNLSGSIPSSLQSMRYLYSCDVSFNGLSGQIPSNGSFTNFTSKLFASNEGLCGDPRYHVPPCRNIDMGGSDKRKLNIAIVCALLGITLMASATTLAFIVAIYRRKNVIDTQTSIEIEPTLIRVSYYDIENITQGFCESNLIGLGGFSSVYKGTLQDGEFVAIKVLNLQVECAYTNFHTECELLSRLRHRNICKMIGVCSSENFKGLVLEYMPNGSLEKWLYLENCFLNVMQRVRVMVDVAFALEYLHHGYLVSVVHRDLKPSNVLLDENMVAHLSDFGISKQLNDGYSIAQSKTLATIGYMAPEYGSEGLVSVRSDVYSYGIMLMEVFTRMKPSRERFVGDLSLKGLVHYSWPNGISQVIDSRLLRQNEQFYSQKLECLSSIMELALKCTIESANNRISMKDVVVQLQKIETKLLTCSQENARERTAN